MDSVRKVDELGRVVLPVEMRKALGIEERNGLDIFVEGDKIILQKNEPDCIVCRSMNNMKKYNDKDVCGMCYDKLSAS